ncbi:hypothetical protein CSKR_111594 [Clonorchis sinensis]|uniref:Cytochrome P450 n=2 Tax=Clonorchis sinensis TaxID=79923 RepID=A0A8T1MC21_CLOSI|nr:hypothetical protein CSKR_111594 [Clonorchis sinensis]
METPNIYYYDWLFTPHRSVDLSLKILVTVFVFLTLLLIAAWHASRKYYRRAPRDNRFMVPKIGDLYRFDFQLLLSGTSTTSCSEVVTGRLGRYTAVVVNDWKLIKLHEQSIDLDCFYSAAPGALRSKWYGVLLSDSSLFNRSQLRAVLLHAFDTLPNGSYTAVGLLGTNLLGLGEATNHQLISSEAILKEWMCGVLAEFLFFNSSEFANDMHESVAQKANFVSHLKSLVNSLESFHTDGKPSNYQDTVLRGPSTVAELLSSTDRLLSPLVQHAMARSLSHTQEFPSRKLQVKSRSDSYLNRLVRTYHQLNEEGEFVDFMHMTHLTHCLSEICLILRFILARNLRLLFAALAQRPVWQQRLREEVLSSSKESSAMIESGVPDLRWASANLLLQRTDQLVWTKALVNEAMRFTAPGWPWGCIRQATRDGRIQECDYAQDDLILFNQPAYLSDPTLWNGETLADSSSPTPHLGFNPWRFLDPEVSILRNQKLCLPVHWAQFVLMGYTVCIPNECIYRLLTALLLHLSYSGWRIQNASPNDELNLTDDPVLLTSDLPSVLLHAPHLTSVQ